MRPEAILWDWDNTLVDAWGGIQAALNATFAEHGLPAWSRAETLGQVRGAMHETFPALFGPGWRAAAESFRAHHRALQLDHLAPMPGVLDVIEAFAGTQAVVSNKEGVPLRREVAHLGWNRHFRAIVGADDAAAAKPDPAPIWYALENIGVKPSVFIWYIGDTAVDMLAARAAGVTAVLLGDAAHDGGVAELTRRGAQPHLHFVTADALAIRLGSG
jgi:phosphoglycolate phosphatase